MASISVSLDRNADRHDVKLLKRELDTLPGVTSVSVSSGGQLAVDYDATGVRQADILEKHVVRPECIETTALGAAYLAGLQTGFWKDKEDIRANWALERSFVPLLDKEDRDRRLKGWKKAVKAALFLAQEDE